VRRIGYIVSRFPLITETFILREIAELDRRPGTHVELFSLFAAPEGPVHDAAKPWMPRLRRAEYVHGAAAVVSFLVRRPASLLRAVADLVTDYRSNPRFLLRALATFVLAADIARQVERTSVSHVHAHFATYPALAAWLAARLTGVTYSFTPHAHDIFVHQLGLARRLREAAFVIGITEYNRRFLIEHGAPAERVNVVRCGIDPGAYAFRPRTLESRTLRGVCVASFKEYKGQRVLVEALAADELVRESIAIDFIGDGPLRPATEQIAERLGVRAQTNFVGSLPETEVAARLAEADFMVLPSVVAEDGDTEGLPIVLMEALAAGLPVVASRLTGIPELIRDGETGILVEPNDAVELARGLRRLLDDDGSRSRAERGRAVVERDHDIRASVDRLEQLFAAATPAP